MQIRTSFVGNSSSSSFIIKNKLDKQRSIWEFAAESFPFVIDYIRDYWSGSDDEFKRYLSDIDEGMSRYCGYNEITREYEHSLDDVEEYTCYEFEPNEEGKWYIADNQGSIFGAVFLDYFRDKILDENKNILDMPTFEVTYYKDAH